MHYKVTFDVSANLVTEVLVEAANESEAKRLAAEATDHGREAPHPSNTIPTVYVADRHTALDDGECSPPHIELANADEIAAMARARKQWTAAAAMRKDGLNSQGTPSNDDPSNVTRALRINHILDVYVAEELNDSFDIDNTVGDLGSMLADVMHYCDFRKVDFASVLALAKDHYAQEQPFKGDQA